MAIFDKKTWKARVTQRPNQRKLTKQDGSVEVVTVERDEGTVTQEGDAFSAANMNDLENRIAEALTSKVVNITPGGYDSNVSFYGNGSAVIFADSMGLITLGFRCKSKPEGSVLFNISPAALGWNSFKSLAAIGALSSVRDNFNYPANSSFRLNANGDVVNVTGVGVGDNNWKYFQITIPLARDN